MEHVPVKAGRVRMEVTRQAWRNRGWMFTAMTAKQPTSPQHGRHRVRDGRRSGVLRAVDVEQLHRRTTLIDLAAPGGPTLAHDPPATPTACRVHWLCIAIAQR
jgi:hypothetical protein